MPKLKQQINPLILQSALSGLEAQRDKIAEQIDEVRSLMGRRMGRPPGSQNNVRHGRRSLSAAARKRISVAQRKRWREARAATRVTKKATKKKSTRKAAKKETASGGE